jgi:hypothetical protein
MTEHFPHMFQNIYLIVAAIGLLETKHLAADFFLQSKNQLRCKGIYGHPVGMLHSAIHAGGSCAVFLIFPTTIAVGVSLIALEFLLHYHIDWGKERLGSRLKLNPSENLFWRLFGIDQWLHHLTYLIYIVVLAPVP